jgi:DNA modification methylase
VTTELDIDMYETDDATGENWHLMLGDSCERLAEIEENSVGLSVYSPPFASLFTYSPSVRDLGNAADRQEFLTHYGYIIREILRITMPGRVTCVHVQQLTTTKALTGYTGLTDFRGEVIRAYIENGWIFHGEVTVNKDPQAQAIRTKAQALMFVTKNRDSAATRPALADYLLLFRKPGDNLIPIKNDVTNDEWIDWAQPVWWNIRETRTLNARLGREAADERHICPLQLDFIERCVRLWSNPGETVVSPFAGIGSEVYTAVKLGRRGVGIELKPSYWAQAVKYLTDLEVAMGNPVLDFGGSDEAEGD